MRRVEKIALLTQALKGDLAKIRALKQDQDKDPIVFFVDNTPKGWFGDGMENIPVMTTYSIHGEETTEYLTRTQMCAKTRGVITIMPNNHRRTK